MSEVKRYDLTHGFYIGDNTNIAESESGDYVLYSDYKSKEAECKKLRHNYDIARKTLLETMEDCKIKSNLILKLEQNNQRILAINKNLLDACVKIMTLFKRTESGDYGKADEWTNALLDLESAIQEAKEGMK